MPNSPRPTGDFEVNLYLEEYKTLRDETIKRIEGGNNIINLTFVATALLWSIGQYTDQGTIIFGLYPVFAMFFASAYAANLTVINEIGHYIRNHLEKKMLDLTWANYFDQVQGWNKAIHQISVYGIFGLGSLLSLIYYRIQITFEGLPAAIFIFGTVALIVNVLILYKTIHDPPKNVGSKVAKISRDKATESKNKLTSPAEGESK